MNNESLSTSALIPSLVVETLETSVGSVVVVVVGGGGGEGELKTGIGGDGDGGRREDDSVTRDFECGGGGGDGGRGSWPSAVRRPNDGLTDKSSSSFPAPSSLLLFFICCCTHPMRWQISPTASPANSAVVKRNDRKTERERD